MRLRIADLPLILVTVGVPSEIRCCRNYEVMLCEISSSEHGMSSIADVRPDALNSLSKHDVECHVLGLTIARLESLTVT